MTPNWKLVDCNFALRQLWETRLGEMVRIIHAILQFPHLADLGTPIVHWFGNYINDFSNPKIVVLKHNSIWFGFIVINWAGKNYAYGGNSDNVLRDLNIRYEVRNELEKLWGIEEIVPMWYKNCNERYSSAAYAIDIINYIVKNWYKDLNEGFNCQDKEINNDLEFLKKVNSIMTNLKVKRREGGNRFLYKNWTKSTF